LTIIRFSGERKKYYPIIYWGNGNRIIDKSKPWLTTKDYAQKKAMGHVSRFFDLEMRPFVKVATRKARFKMYVI
jgi:hypothetical protein